MQDNEQQAILASVLRTAVDAIILIDQFGTIESANPATEQMFGYSTDEMLGQNVKMLMPSPYHEQHDGYLKRYHDTGERRIIGIGREVVGRRKDGSTFPIHLAVSEVDQGGRRLFTGIIRDISDLKAVEAELKTLNVTLDQRVREQAEELAQANAELVETEKFATLGRISGGIAHEIRNPLNAIKTSAYYLLNAKTLSKAKTSEHLTRIERQVTIIDSAVTALSDLARLPEPKSLPCDIVAIVKDAVQSTQLPSEITIDRDFPSDLPFAIADEKQISIVFNNLIRNARDAMLDGGGVLTLSVQVDGDFVNVTVRDTGTGIANELLDRIEEPFFSTKSRGMGLGLAISRAIVEKNRGAIGVKTKVGEGTAFSVSLPRQSGDIDGEHR